MPSRSSSGRDRKSGHGRYSRPDSARSDVVHEHVEKLFACFLRLPPIDSAEIGKLVLTSAEENYDAYRERAGALGDKMRSGVDHLRDTLPKDIPASEPEGVRAQAKTNIEVAAKNLDTVREVLDEMKPAYSAPRPSRPPDLREIPLWGVDLNYSPTEKTVLAERIPELMMEGGRRPSPRAVRLFLYKYQLCRTLLRLSQGAGLASEALPTDRALVDALGAACFNPAWRPAGKVNRATLESVVQQVA